MIKVGSGSKVEIDAKFMNDLLLALKEESPNLAYPFDDFKLFPDRKPSFTKSDNFLENEHFGVPIRCKIWIKAI